MIENAQLTARRLWQQLSLVQRLTLIGSALVVVAGLAFLANWATTPTYGVLFSGLSSDDAGSIVSQLTASKVPYQLADGGATILVPQDKVDAERLQLATQGLPQGGVVGFSLFDKTSIFQSDNFTEQINYTRALEGELTKTISQIAGVAYARVNIVLPQQQLFTSQQASPTASVLLKFRTGASLSPDQIAGIQHLVASAVENLKPDAVTVVDGSGMILTNTSSPDGAGPTGLTILAAQARYASQLEAQLTAMLDTVLGPDRAVVRVSDTMDWTQRDSTSNTYLPQSPGSTISESHVTTNSSTDGTHAVGGIAGLGSNVPTYGTSSYTQTQPYTQTQQSTDIVYATSNTVSHVVQAPGTVQRLSVAVLLDGVSSTGEIASLRAAIGAAAGLIPARGDQLSISSVAFDQSATTAATRAAAAAQQQEFIVNVVRWASLLVVPLILLFLLRRLLVAERVRRYTAEDAEDAEVIEEGQPLLASTGVATAAAAQLEARRSMAALARERPEAVANLIGRWIEEDRG